MIPLLALNLLQYSSNWQASDVFRAAPMRGPGPLCHGARRAILCVLALPLAAAFGLMIGLAHRGSALWLLIVPGLIALPVYPLLPNVGGKAVPLSLPAEEAKSASRGLVMIGGVMVSMALSGVVAWSWAYGWFWELVGVEAVVALALYAALRRRVTKARWPALE